MAHPKWHTEKASKSSVLRVQEEGDSPGLKASAVEGDMFKLSWRVMAAQPVNIPVLGLLSAGKGT